MKYKVNQEVTYKPLNQRARVTHVTPYHEDGDPHAMITIELLKNNDARTFGVAVQDRYITTEPVKSFFGRWPLTPAASK